METGFLLNKTEQTESLLSKHTLQISVTPEQVTFLSYTLLKLQQFMDKFIYHHTSETTQAILGIHKSWFLWKDNSFG